MEQLCSHWMYFQEILMGIFNNICQSNVICLKSEKKKPHILCEDTHKFMTIAMNFILKLCNCVKMSKVNSAI